MPSPELFSLRSVKGPKAIVLAAIEKSAAPAEAKAYLAHLVNSRPCEGVVLDCHSHSNGDEVTDHITVKKLY